MNKKKVIWQQYIGLAFYGLLGIICGYIMVQYWQSVNTPGKPIWGGLLALLGLFAIMYIAIFMQMIIHEIGHFLFGLLSGYQFSSFRIMSFMLVKENGKLQFRRLSIAGTGGQCLMAPPELKDGKIPVILYNLGGSIFNILFGSLFLLLHFILAELPFLSASMLIISIIGFTFAIMNGVPMRLGTVDNDGYNTISLSRSQDALKAFWIQMKINQNISEGLRLKDMPDEWFAIPEDTQMKNSMIASIGVFTCNRLMDQHQFQEADRSMAHILSIDSGIVGLHRNLIICDRIFCELICQNRRDVIHAMLTDEQKRFMKSMGNFPSVLRTLYAYELLSNKDKTKAQNIMEQFEKSANAYPYPQEVQAEQEYMALANKIADGE